MLLILGFEDPASVDAFRLEIPLCRLVDLIIAALDAVVIERVEIFLGVLADWKAHWQHRAMGRTVGDMMSDDSSRLLRWLSRQER